LACYLAYKEKDRCNLLIYNGLIFKKSG